MADHHHHHHHHEAATQVANAAALVVAPQTDAATRQAASAFLESWTHSPQAWDLYGPWLASFVTTTGTAKSDGNNNNRSVELLCLQLCQAKIRRELPRQTNAATTTASAASLEAIRHALTQLVLSSQQNPQDGALLQSACICLTSLEVRMTSLTHFLPSILASCSNTHAAAAATNHPDGTTAALLPWTALKLLAEIPTELESCIDMPSASSITQELVPHWPAIQTVVAQHLESTTTTSLAAVQVLKSWVKTCHVTLSHLNTPTMLPRLVQCLAQTTYHSDQAELVTAVAKCLTTVLRQPADSCTPERQAAVVALVDATRVDGFIGGPLLYAAAQSSTWDDAAPHALVTFLTTLVTEDIDEIIALPADGLLHLLLEIQRTHPVLRIRSLVLEAWLTVQDVPLQERHAQWRAPLQAQIVETLCHSLQYPPNFLSWDEEIHVEQDECEEYRRLAPDVLVGCFHLLRADFVQRLTEPILSSSASWTQREAALFALAATAREVCGRIKTTVGGSAIMQDKQRTATLLQQVANALLVTNNTHPHQPPQLMDTQCQFFGAYSAGWVRSESPGLVWGILEQLRVVLEGAGLSSDNIATVRASAAQALKSILTVSAPRLLDTTTTTTNALQASLQGLFALALQSHEESTMLPVTEGCVRLLAQVPDVSERDHALLALAHTLTEQGHKALAIMPTDGSSLSEQGIVAMHVLEKYLHVIVVMIKFAQSDAGPPPLSSALNQYLWPFLETASQRMHHYETVLDGILSVKQQLLRSMPDWLAAQFTSTLENWVRVFEQTKKSNTLAYFSSAVEAYGAREASAFENLLNHVSQVFFGYISSEKPVHECTDLVEAYFEMCQRYFLFASASIARCEALPLIASCAVECLTACHGERNSTRATLNFLEKLVSWRRLPVAAELRQALELASQRLDELIAAHGQRLIQSCTDMLVGGPRMLWPPAGDVIFSVVLASIAWPVPEATDSSVARQWLESVSLTSNNNTNHAATQHVKQEQTAQMFREVVGQLLALAQKGPTMKGKAKLLLSDFSLAVNGHKVPETLHA